MTKQVVVGSGHWDPNLDAPIYPTPGLNLNILCHCACNGDAPPGGLPRDDCGLTPHDALSEHVGEFCVEAGAPHVVSHAPSTLPPPKPLGERVLVQYCAALNLPLAGPPTRVDEVLHLLPDDDNNDFETVRLTLHVNGFAIMPLESKRDPVFIAWSPFSLVQACRLHTVQADNALPWLRLFKVSVFHHGSTHFFAVQGEGADGVRARWVADIARSIRTLTQSLFPPFSISTTPLVGARWTATRLMAGFMVMCNNQDVCLTYCELHAQRDCEAAFVAYKDEYCDARIVHCNIGINTAISERVGVDCSCFSVDGHHFCTRSSQEKTLWLRAISNVKVKLRHNAGCPTDTELAFYRAAIQESLSHVKTVPENSPQSAALLPRQLPRRSVQTTQERTQSRVSSRSSTRAGGQDLVAGRSSVRLDPNIQCENIVDGEDESTVITIGPARDPRADALTIGPTQNQHRETSKVGKSLKPPGVEIKGPMSGPPRLPELNEDFELTSELAYTNGSSDGSFDEEDDFTSTISPVSEAKYTPSKLPDTDEPSSLQGGLAPALPAFPVVASEHLPVNFIM